ncbi:phosphonate ABC transporter, periplasmic phosphonate-binding protein [Thiorhodococcus drewsii AZ1]|uniref:Phosphonate ABC transporter, periplasmic phosphonate-binding protein n=2 Tax=Thiorhodococcus drewsii TaxID=210408 RepID=G2E5I3_9GAMM|nr:phosphonate ABC transporter, periplasmic phosphonate-binding protein [Thiorhodococcus drewsii AZ1]
MGVYMKSTATRSLRVRILSVLTMVAVLFAGVSTPLLADDTLVFGTLPITKPTKLLQRYKGLVQYYEEVLGQPVRFEIGKDYQDAIQKFQSGHYDFGLLGPSPYVMATETSSLGKDNFKLIGTLETGGKPYYNAVVIAAIDDTDIQSLQDLEGKTFAFGSRLSTLSCYLPADMLIQAGVLDKLASYDFIGKHDAVANAVALGRFDAGGIKEGVYKKFEDRIRIVEKSQPVWDFLILAHKDMPEDLFERIKTATLDLKDPAILDKVKPNCSGFVATEDANYDNLRAIMKRVDDRLGAPEL